jgi:hypothetical protein
MEHGDGCRAARDDGIDAQPNGVGDFSGLGGPRGLRAAKRPRLDQRGAGRAGQRRASRRHIPPDLPSRQRHSILIGGAVIGFFAASWAVSLIVYRLKRYDEIAAGSN